MTCFLNKSRGKFVINIGIMKILFQFLLCQGNTCCDCRLIGCATIQLDILYLISIRTLNTLQYYITLIERTSIAQLIISIYKLYTYIMYGLFTFQGILSSMHRQTPDNPLYLSCTLLLRRQMYWLARIWLSCLFLVHSQSP